ncbi:hypothetical protein [Bradyrhizobium sp. dw_411]|uniref:hypothetical protein n=1 Tax=Bradyrhizobium sp. dw_411 TaxID=2720082 RepID=UPI00201C9F02|nr:hypothetical protein [Bradyrhizobium sp. dw_411]
MAAPTGIALEEKSRSQRKVIERTIGSGGQKNRIDRRDKTLKQNDVLTGDHGQRIVAGQRHSGDIAAPWHDVIEQRSGHSENILPERLRENHLIGAGGIEEADVARLERGLLLALADRAGAFFLNHQKPGWFGLHTDQFAGATNPLRIGFDMHQVEARHMRERNWLGVDSASIGMRIAKRSCFDARDGVAHNFTPKIETLRRRHACRRQQARDLPIFGQQGSFAMPCRAWQRSHGGPR